MSGKGLSDVGNTALTQSVNKYRIFFSCCSLHYDLSSTGTKSWVERRRRQRKAPARMEFLAFTIKEI